jgi:hypothetical protein
MESKALALGKMESKALALGKMESKALALGKQVCAYALNSKLFIMESKALGKKSLCSVHLTLIIVEKEVPKPRIFTPC